MPSKKTNVLSCSLPSIICIDIMYIQTLSGCSPVPLAYYLKALGVLRLVAGSPSGDPTAKAAWVTDELRLSSRFNQEELVSFFLQDYQPTPVLAPWNGGSGCYKKDNREAIEALAASASPRLSPYRTGIDHQMTIWPFYPP